MRSGFTLIEIMIAMLVFFVGIIGVFSLLSFLSKTSLNSQERFIASQLAQEGVELARNFRDSNWISFDNYTNGLDVCINGCEIAYNELVFSPYAGRFLKINANGFYNYQIGDNSLFQRKITIIPQPDHLGIKAEIFWRGNVFQIQDNLYDWYNN